MTHTLRRLRLAMLAAPLLLGACGQDITAKTGTVPARMIIVSGDAQSAPAGSKLPQPLTVRVVDSSNRPVPGALVNFRLTEGGGSLFAGAALTNADGIARERWTLGTRVGEAQRVEARAVDSDTGEEVVYGAFTATVTAAAPHTVTAVNFHIVSGPFGIPLADSIRVRVTDQFGNPVPNLAVGWNPYLGGGSASPLVSVTNADGIAATTWTLSPNMSIAQALAAHAGELPHFTFLGTATINPASTIEIVGGDNQTVERGAAVPERLAVVVRAPDGRPVIGAPVTWNGSTFTNSNGPQTVIGPTNAEGRSEAIAPRLFQTGTDLPYASAYAVFNKPVTFRITAVEGTPTTLAPVGSLSRFTSRGSSLALQVRVNNAHGFTVSGQTVNWSVDPAKGTLSATQSVTQSSTGTAQVTFTVLSTAVSPATVTATWGTQQVQYTVNF